MSEKESRLIWISPVISQQEIEGLFHWVNVHLTQAGIMPIASFSQIKTELLIDPEEALKFIFEVRPLGREHSIDVFKESIWSEVFARSSPGPLPHMISLHSLEVANSTKKLICFDMDSTLINEEVIDEMARKIGVYDEIAKITELAMQGKLDFKAALRERVKFFKGMTYSQIMAIIPSLTFSSGAEKLLGHTRFQGTKTVVVSGGFQNILDYFKKTLYLDQVFGNHLVSDDDGKLTGAVEDPILDADRKQRIVSQMKENYDASIAQTICVGDGANDLKMMQEAGLSVSFCGKPKLNAHVNTLILQRNLLWLKPLL